MRPCRRSPHGTKHITLDLGVGPTQVDLEWDGAAKKLRFAWMTQPRPTVGSVFENRDEAARSLGLEPEDLNPDGVAMHRPCEISIRIASEGEHITRVQIGGAATLAGEGTLRV